MARPPLTAKLAHNRISQESMQACCDKCRAQPLSRDQFTRCTRSKDCLYIT